MYSPQSANLVTHRGTRGLPAILAALAVVAIVALTVGVLMATAATTKGQIGDHSLDAGESTRAGAFLVEDHTFDQIEAQRSLGLGLAIVPAGPAPTAADDWNSLRKEHLYTVPATTKAAPIDSSRDSMESLRQEHLRRVHATKAAPAITYDTWGGGR
jgi:hypothetical protein